MSVSKIIGESLEAKTSNYVITSEDNGKVFSNSGATGEITFTLPSAVAGMILRFINAEDQRLKVEAASGNTRGLFAGGYNFSTRSNVIDYVTISTLGNATDFGDLWSNLYALAGVSNKVRAIFGGGTDGSYNDTIQYVNIDTTGNTTDFGDLTQARNTYCGASNGHGGLN